MQEQRDNLAGVYVVVPAYNEAAVIGEVVADLARFVPPRQVIVVDDASGDDTAQAACRAGATVLRHAINRGQGAALATGIQSALRLGASAIVTFDADHQHQADDLPAMVQPVLDGEADVVLGTRFGAAQSSRHIPAVRRMLLRAAVLYTRVSVKLRVSDTHNGFRVLSAKAAGLIRIHQDRMEHASEILEQIAKHRLRYVERPVNVRYTAYSLGKGQRNRDAFKIMFKLLLHRVTG